MAINLLTGVTKVTTNQLSINNWYSIVYIRTLVEIGNRILRPSTLHVAFNYKRHP